MSTSSQSITVSPSPLPDKVDANDIFSRIDRVREGIKNDLEPSFLAQLFSANKRQQAAALNEVKVNSIRARAILIEGLSQTIATFVDIHGGDLKVRGKAHVLATFAEMTKNLDRVIGSTYTAFIDTYATAVERIEAMPKLTEAQRQQQIAAAWERALRAQQRGEETFNAVLDSLRDQVVQIVEEIGAKA
jgi:hypothetical protein